VGGEGIGFVGTAAVVAVLPHRSDSFPGFDPDLLQMPISGHLRPLRDRIRPDLDLFATIGE